MDTVPHYTSDDNPHYVYGLTYPIDYPDSCKAGTIFYIGKGIGTRIYAHEWEAKTGQRVHNKHKVNTIRKIWKSGGKVTKKILAHFATHEEACMYEIALIFLLSDLTNITIGGDGLPGRVRPQEEREKIRQWHLGRPMSKDVVAKTQATRARIRANRASTIPNICTIEEVMDMLCISKRTVFRYIDKGMLTPIIVEKNRFFDREEVSHVKVIARSKRHMEKMKARYQDLWSQAE